MNRSNYFNHDNNNTYYQKTKYFNQCLNNCYKCPPYFCNPICATGATGTSQISVVCIITTTNINSILTVQNPADNSTSLTITPNAGGTQSVSAHLTIIQLS